MELYGYIYKKTDDRNRVSVSFEETTTAKRWKLNCYLLPWIFSVAKELNFYVGYFKI